MRISGFAIRAAILCGTAAGLAYPAVAAAEAPQSGAQLPTPADTAEAQTTTDDADAIVITGTRLRSDGFQAPTPVSVVGSEELKLTGAQSVEATLTQNPQFLGNLFNGAGNGQNQGVAALNLRGLGERRSLTLVNGRRYTVTGTSNLTDLNTIPTSLIKQVEVVTGGSSAVYGSDALAGVVNFILRDDFEGVEVGLQHSRDEHTWTPSSTVDLTIGGNFGNGRGNAVVALGYMDREPITRGQFAFAKVQLNDGCVTADSFSKTQAGTRLAVLPGQTCSGSGGRAGLLEANSATIPGGRFTGVPLFGSAQSNAAIDAALVAAGLQNLTSFGFTLNPGTQAPRAALDPADRYNNSPLNYMLTPLERWMVNGFAKYDLTDNMTGYVETHFSRYKSDVQIAPLALTNSVLIDVSNPYLSAPMREVLRQMDIAETATTTVRAGLTQYTNAPNDGRVTLTSNRRFEEGGPGRGTSERNVFRTAVGIRGDLGSDFNYDLYYSYANTNLVESQSAGISRTKFQQALLSQGGAAPLINIFGPNITNAAYAAISVPQTNVTSNSQHVVAGNITGSTASFLNLPAGAIDFSTGFEWRKNSLSVDPDALGALGEAVTPLGTPSRVKGSTTVKEVYGEVRIPILADKPFFNRLAFNGAVRYSDYNTAGVGEVWTHSLGLQWQPMRDLTLRAQFQRALRAPGVDELYGPQSGGTPVVNDPCSSRASSSQQTAQVRALCIATGVPAGNVFTSVVQPNAQVGTLNGGNPNVGPENANTFTLGVVYTPHQVPGLGISLDFYKIKLKGAIAPLGGGIQNTFNLCYNVLQDASSAYCQAIHRDPASGELTSNNLTDGYHVDQFLANTGGIVTSGADINVRYGFDLGEARVSVSTALSYSAEYSFVPVQDLAVTNECVGSYGSTCGQPAPRLKGVSRLSWEKGPLTLSLRHRFTGPVTRDLFLVPLRQGKTPPAKSDITAANVGAQHYFDFAFSANVNQSIELTGGINNLFDRSPPLLGSGAQTWGVNTAPGVYEIYGRNYFLGAKIRF